MNATGNTRVAAARGSAALFSFSGCGGPLREAPASVFRLEEATVADINAAFDAGALTCQGLVELYLSRVAAYDDTGPSLNSMITLNPHALDIAEALDEERAATGPRSALHCIPVVLKDNIDTDDMPTSNGAVILKDAVAPDDAFIAGRLRGMGALILGKASLGEFAGGNSYTTVDGQTVNAYHRLRAGRAANRPWRSPPTSPCSGSGPTPASPSAYGRPSMGSSVSARPRD